jgi:hypothetical protein
MGSSKTLNGHAYTNGNGYLSSNSSTPTPTTGTTKIRLVRHREGSTSTGSHFGSNGNSYGVMSWRGSQGLSGGRKAVGNGDTYPSLGGTSSSSTHAHATKPTPNGSSYPHSHGSLTNGYPHTSIQDAHRSLYTRATTSFVKKEFVVAYEVAENGLGLLNRTRAHTHTAHHATSLEQDEDEDGMEEWKIKWDILRLTIEALVYCEPSLIHSSEKGKTKIPNTLEELLTSYSPDALVEKMYGRSLELFFGSGGLLSVSVPLPASVALTLVMAGLKVGAVERSRGIAEEWFALRDEAEETNAQGNEEKEKIGHRKMLRVYGERILPMLGEWDEALQWIEGSKLEKDEKEVSWSNLDGAIGVPLKKGDILKKLFILQALMERVGRRRAEKERGGQGLSKSKGSVSSPPMERARDLSIEGGGRRPEGATATAMGKETAPGRRVASPGRVCSPASVASSSSSSSLLTHSTHTAVPTGGVGREEGEQEEGSVGTVTPRLARETPSAGTREAPVGALQGYLKGVVGRGNIIGLLMVLMGFYWMRRKRVNGWLRRSLVDFLAMALRGLAL